MKNGWNGKNGDKGVCQSHTELLFISHRYQIIVSLYGWFFEHESRTNRTDIACTALFVHADLADFADL